MGFPSSYGPLVSQVGALDLDDAALWSVDGVIVPVAASAARGAVSTLANTGTAYTATRTTFAFDFLLTVTGNATITLAGGSVANEVSIWNVIFKQDATGGRSIVVTGVVWVGGTPAFNTTALASNHCTFVQHGTGTIYGYFGGSAAS